MVCSYTRKDSYRDHALYCISDMLALIDVFEVFDLGGLIYVDSISISFYGQMESLYQFSYDDEHS